MDDLNAHADSQAVSCFCFVLLCFMLKTVWIKKRMNVMLSTELYFVNTVIYSYGSGF